VGWESSIAVSVSALDSGTGNVGERLREDDATSRGEQSGEDLPHSTGISPLFGVRRLVAAFSLRDPSRPFPQKTFTRSIGMLPTAARNAGDALFSNHAAEHQRYAVATAATRWCTGFSCT